MPKSRRKPEEANFRRKPQNYVLRVQKGPKRKLENYSRIAPHELCIERISR